MNTPKQSADIIINLLKEKNTSIEKMLRECNLKPRIISNMKSGSMPSVDKIIIIAKYLDVSVEYLMGVADIPSPHNKKAPAVLEKAEALKILAKDKLGHEPTKEDLKRLEELTEVIFKKFE